MLVLMTCLRIHVLMVGLWCFKGTISASRGAAVPSRHRRASSPGEEVVGGLFFDFEAGVDGSATGEPMWERRSGPRPNPLPRRGVLDLATCDAGAVAGSGIKTRC